ncbi:MAG: L,D-transpeptidase family protein [Ilumatobacteraceae bacterium]|nr:L,D-transpeptidase family protein [Ilumatobacteraceae bacterium]
MNDQLHPPAQAPAPSAAKWLPAIAAAGVLGTVVIAGVAMGGGGSGGGGDSQAGVVGAPSESVLPIPDSVPVIETVETSSPVEKTVLDRTVSNGMVGSDIQAIQTRLDELGFWPGPADGIFGEQTRAAVWAYEKLIMGADATSPSGQVTPAMWDEMQDPFVIRPRRPDSTPNHTEVYLEEQVLAIFHDDVPVMISHISSGDNEEWCEEVTISPGEYGNENGEEPLVRGECGVSVTPGGVYNVNRKVEGIRQSALGGMWDPVYFNYGIAIHGALNVPTYRASHGCIRVPLSISPDMYALMGFGDQVFVWDGENEPEFYGPQPPRFNWQDPDYSTTTTSTIPATTTTEDVPDTTVAPQTTTATTAAPTTAATTTTTVAEQTTTTAAPTTVAAPDGGGTGGTGGSDSSGDMQGLTADAGGEPVDE